MKLSETDIQLLEDYWHERLEPRQREALEQRLATDTVFAEAAREWQLIITEGFLPSESEREEMAAIRERLSQYTAEEHAAAVTAASPTPKTARPVLMRRLYLILAVAAAIALLVWLTPLSGLFQPTSPYQDYFAHLPRDNANLSTDAEAGRRAYDQEDYETAFPALLAEVAAGGDSLNLIYAGVAALGSGQPERAIPLLEPLLASDKWRFYHDDIRWYLALAYLQDGQEDKASLLLQRIAQSESEYAESAARLLEESQ